MTPMKKEVLLFCLGAVVSASGHPGPHCLKSSDSYSMDDIEVDCSDISTSLENLVSYFSNGGETCTALVTDEYDVIGSNAYDTVKKQYASSVFDTSPSYIIRANSEVDVQATVKFAALCDFKITPRSGGHSYVASSSCNGDSCIQLDVGSLNQIVVHELPGNQGKQLQVGPGARLRDMAELYTNKEVFIPMGECDDIGVGGHMQTGGIGVWGRQFGYFSSYVKSFRTVLSDGSIRTVTRPNSGHAASKAMNDDIYWATVGGASGSYGIVTDITLDTVDENDYYSFYWEVNYSYNQDTAPGIKAFLKNLGQMLQDDEVANDRRWGLFLSFIGGEKQFESPLPIRLNFLQVDLSWAVQKSEVGSEDEAFQAAQEFYDTLLSECIDCMPLDEYIDDTLAGLLSAGSISMDTINGLKATFKSEWGARGSVSQLYKDLTVFNWSSFLLELRNVPFKASWQQGPKYPNESDMEAIFDQLDKAMPSLDAGDSHFLISQFAFLPIGKPSNDMALPFQGDVLGIVVDLWDLEMPYDTFTQLDKFNQLIGDTQDAVKSGVGADHRMFWNPTDVPCFECGQWEKYYESLEKFERLKDIKTCLDPDNAFENKMSIPVSEE